MGVEEGLLQLFRAFLNEHAIKSHVIGTAVNVGDEYCDVEREGETTIYSVVFHAIEDSVSNKIIIKPKEGSMVICGFLESNNAAEQTTAFIEQCSEIGEVLMQIGNKKYQLKSDGHLIAAGSVSLLDVLTHLYNSIKVISVLYGNNPDFGELAQAKLKMDQILK
jgi:hypothetical protein